MVITGWCTCGGGIRFTWGFPEICFTSEVPRAEENSKKQPKEMLERTTCKSYFCFIFEHEEDGCNSSV